MPQKTVHLETDYLVIGGGAMCMAFVDEMLIGSRSFGNYKISSQNVHLNFRDNENQMPKDFQFVLTLSSLGVHDNHFL